jgi:hypothetical protein
MTLTSKYATLMYIGLISVFILDCPVINAQKHKTKYLDFSKYGYGKVPEAHVSADEFIMAPDGKLKPNKLLIRLSYDQLPDIDRITINENNWYKSGYSVTVKIDASDLLYVLTPDDNWSMLRTLTSRLHLLQQDITRLSKETGNGLSCSVENAAVITRNNESDLAVTVRFNFPKHSLVDIMEDLSAMSRIPLGEAEDPGIKSDTSTDSSVRYWDLPAPGV